MPLDIRDFVLDFVLPTFRRPSANLPQTFRRPSADLLPLLLGPRSAPATLLNAATAASWPLQRSSNAPIRHFDSSPTTLRPGQLFPALGF